MLVDFYIFTALKSYEDRRTEKSFSSQIWYRSLDLVKKTASLGKFSYNFQKVIFLNFLKKQLQIAIFK